MAEFLMPSLGADMEDGTLVEWQKTPGDPVEKGDVIAVVETAKGAIEIEAYERGVLESILVEVGSCVPVGTPLALIGAARDEAAGSGARAASIDRPSMRSAEREAPAIAVDAVASADVEPVAETDNVGGRRETAAEDAARRRAASSARKESMSASHRRVTPLARRRARSAGLDLARVDGSGPDGAIRVADVEAALARSALPASGAADRRADAGVGGPRGAACGLPDGMRDAIARSMSRSKREIPHYYLAHTVDLTALNEHLKNVNASRPPRERLLLGALLIAAVARAVRAHPLFNGHMNEGVFEASDAVHVGMAIRLRGGGLVAPAIHEADRLEPDRLMTTLRDLTARVRAGQFRASELTDPTLTISSVGERGVGTLYGVIHPPQVCLIGFGAPSVAPHVRDDRIVAAPQLSMTLAADHRVSDGHAGSRFLVDIARYLEQPASWLDAPRASTATATSSTEAGHT